MYLATDDDRELAQSLESDCRALTALVEYSDPRTGDRHRLFRLDDADKVAHYRTLLDSRSVVIADGHHRTKVAQMYARAHPELASTAAHGKLAVIISLASSDLVIDPIHRAVTVPVDREALVASFRSRRPIEAADGHALAAAVAAAPQPTVGVRWRGAPAELWTLDPERAPADMPGGKADLAVVLLHHQLLPATGLHLEAASDGSVQYRSDPDDLYRMVDSEAATLGIWLPPMSPDSFALAVSDGSVLPPKSTRFLPKLASGLVWCGHDARIS